MQLRIGGFLMYHALVFANGNGGEYLCARKLRLEYKIYRNERSAQRRRACSTPDSGDT